MGIPLVVRGRKLLKNFGIQWLQNPLIKKNRREAAASAGYTASK
jgi:hypothetical protein